MTYVLPDSSLQHLRSLTPERRLSTLEAHIRFLSEDPKTYLSGTSSIRASLCSSLHGLFAAVPVLLAVPDMDKTAELPYVARLLKLTESWWRRKGPLDLDMDLLQSALHACTSYLGDYQGPVFDLADLPYLSQEQAFNLDEEQREILLAARGSRRLTVLDGIAGTLVSKHEAFLVDDDLFGGTQEDMDSAAEGRILWGLTVKLDLQRLNVLLSVSPDPEDFPAERARVVICESGLRALLEKEQDVQHYLEIPGSLLREAVHACTRFLGTDTAPPLTQVSDSSPS